MKTKQSLKQSPSGSVSIVLEIPSDFIPETTPQQLQTLLRRF